ncbi:LysR family transcriptional regulator [Clostridium diolis]|uniref:Transcription regulator n=1 Tax=Clostridium diolis TaxID=223919 RepID=A0AAV3W777_9CLOT|nr:LysR family transcriptional regulator [Clostridium diolis]QES73440.1 LysR family transcriptional regulator [Clostridium diolis]GEA32829.1 transcription regulator [Clostridium diolis]
MDIKQLKYFLQICEDESFSKAAKNLYITQQGLSKAIKSLEECINAPLFYRTVSGLKLTEYGKYLKEHSIHLINEFDLILNDINKMTSLNRQKLSVGFSFGVLNALSTDLIDNFKQNNPNIQLTTAEYRDFDCEKAILTGELDVALTVGPVDESKFNFKIVQTHNLCALINDKHYLSQKSEISFKDLKNEKIIIVDKNFKLYHNFIEKCRQAAFEPDIAFTTAEILITHKLSRLNKGIGISVDFVVSDINYPNVYSIPFIDKSFVWNVTLIYKKDSILSYAGKIFTDYIIQFNEK